jgi:DNA-3-methyladenine glycosylase II
MPLFKAALENAAKVLASSDPTLKPIIERAGPCSLKPHQNYYQELVESIIGQQLSIKAAAAIEARFIALFEGSFPSPPQILEKNIGELRAIGFSRAKANYVHDLAEHVIDGRLQFKEIDAKTNAEIITLLTDIKGIGEWTAHMFLIFCMGRLDILPVGDLGIRNGIRKLYNFDELPTPEQIKDLAGQNHWHPYESVASWYVWYSLDNKSAVS